MKRLRILMLAPAPNLPGGVGDFIRMIGDQLGVRHDCQSSQVGRDGSAIPAPLRVLRDGWRLLRTLRRMRPDIVQLNPSFDRAAVRDAFNLLVVRVVHAGPIVVFNHGWSAVWPERIDRSALLRWLVRRLFGRADRIYVLAGSSRNALLRWGLGDTTVRSTSTMYDRRQFDVPDGPGRHDAEARPLQVLFLSRLVQGKGARELIHAFAALSERFPRASLVIAGDGDDRPAVEAAARASGVADRIRFTGFVRGTDKARLMLASDLFVFPSRLAEGCPVSLLEALGAGLPVIASGTGGIVDVFAAGAQGSMLSACPTVAEIEHALARWLADAPGRAAAGAANRSLAVERYDAAAWCRALEEDYLALAASRAAALAHHEVTAGQE